VINSLEPEIKLAIQFSKDKSNSAVTTTTPSDDDQEVEEFVSSHGFEFIDGDNDSLARALDLDDDSTGEFFPRTQHIPPPRSTSSPSLSFVFLALS